MAKDFHKLVSLLHSPRELRATIESLRHNEDLDDSTLGFIAMYDELGGDEVAIKLQMRENKIKITRSLKKPRRYVLLKYCLAYAACIFLCIWLYFLFENYSNDSFLTNVYKDPGLPNYMSDSNRNGHESIMFYYRKENYSIAIQMIDKEILHKGTNDTLIYYRSLFSYLSHQDKNAMLGFRIISHSSSVYRDRARYFIALHYVKKKMLYKAKLIFKELCNSSDQSIASFSSKHLKQLKINR
jgi:hypothetical protein